MSRDISNVLSSEGPLFNFPLKGLHSWETRKPETCPEQTHMLPLNTS